MVPEKTVLDHASDFLDGAYNTYIAVPLAFGDFLARISGYRDFQVDSDSVVPDLDTYTYQQQTFDELRMIVKAMWYEESRNPIIDAFITDVQKRPFYYIGSFGTASIIKKTFPSEALKNHYSVLFPLANVDQKVHALFEQARNWVARRDPLVLDLDGDGIETVGISATTHILFDHNNDGIKTGTGWVKGDDGLLVLDRNGNGVIDNGSELFGDSTTVNGVKATDGFSALSAEDSNHNGKFDAGDTNFTNVRVWQDTNQDGISQVNELHSLSELGIKSINLASTATSGWLEGATQTATGTNGTKGEVGNLNFTSNAFYFSRHPELVSGSKREMPNRVRHDGDAVNNFNFKNTRRTA